MLSVGPPTLVADLNTTGRSSFPSSLVRLGDRMLFRADDGYHGREWFASNGSAAGTRLLADINPGLAGSMPALGSYQEDPSAVVGNTLFFAAVDGSRGAELWKTDGTPGGTVLVKDIRPGTAGSSPDYFTAVGDVLYFTADNGTNGRELWRSDGTEAGTVMVIDLPMGTAAGSPIPLRAAGGKLLFAARHVDSPLQGGYELWSTDGTGAGTALLKNIHPAGPSLPGIELAPGNTSTYLRQSVVTAGGHVYFGATDATNGRDLWRTDGTADGTVRVADVTPGTQQPSGAPPLVFPRNLTAVGDTVYFVAPSDAQGRSHSVFRTDPASATGASVVNALAGIGDGGPVLASAGGRLYLVGVVPSTARPGIAGLFTHDPASPVGTPLTLLRNTNLYQSLPRDMLDDGNHYIADFNGEAYVLTSSLTGSSTTLELIRSDGTPQGTTLLAKVPYSYPGGGDPTIVVSPWRAVAGPSAVYFAGMEPAAGAELWRTTGTAFGTGRVADVNTTNFGSSSTGVLDVNGRAVFHAVKPGLGAELWSTDGTAGGTTFLKDINPGSWGSRWVQTPVMHGTLVDFGVNYNGRAYFPAESDAHLELWSTDGTPEGTRIVKDINATYGSFPRELTLFRGRLFFTAEQQTDVGRLWSTDGTEAGTSMLTDPDGNTYRYHDPFRLTVAGDALYFIANTYNSGHVLWKSDGTPEGTVWLRALATPTFPTAMVAFGDGVYFTTRGSLWKSNGTPEGTVAVKTLPGTASDLTAVNGRLMFRAPAASGGADALWVSDGTEAGTAPLQAAAHVALGTPAGLVAEPGGAAAWVFDMSSTGTWHLWRTDGTRDGTKFVRALPPPYGSANAPAPLGFAGGRFYFRAASPAGVELWSSDGTGAGTAMVADINAGPGSSNPGNFGVAGGRIYFTANDGTHGGEMWSIPLRPSVAGRHVFYNNSAHDGRNPAATAADDGAVDATKRPLLPRQSPTAEHITGYTRGLNGVMIDIAGYRGDNEPTLEDFTFRSKRGTGGWVDGPAPRQITFRPRLDGSARITLVWDDHVAGRTPGPHTAVADGWLEITLKATARTGLDAPDTFRFGNLRGDAGGTGSVIRVDSLDLARTRAAVGARAGPTSAADQNRDGRVNVLDLIAVRESLFNTLAPIEDPVAAATSRQAARLPLRRAAYGVL